MDSDVESFLAPDVGAAEDDEEELHIAKALSLSEHVGGNEFKSEVVRGSPELNGYPDYLCLETIEPGGWCFYDAIAVHLFPYGQDGETALKITRGMIASYCLCLLVQRKLEYVDFLQTSLKHYVVNICRV